MLRHSVKNPAHLCSAMALIGSCSPLLSRQTYLYHHYILGALFLNFGVLDFHSHDLPIMQHCLVDLSQGGCTLRLLLKENE